MRKSPQFSTRIERLEASALRTIFHAVSAPGMISFAGGLPAADSFPELPWKILQGRNSYREMLQYGASEGEPDLQELVAKQLAADGLHTDPRRVLILSGSQQGIDLVAKLMIDKDTEVAIETPGYLAAFQVFSLFGARYLPFSPFNPNLLANSERASEPPGLLYTNPSFQNPTSHVYALPERQLIADYCDDSNTVLFEDDPYRDLFYEPCDRTPICSLTRSASWVYQSSFSKTLSPGLRLGYLTCSEDLYPHLLHLKQASDLHSNRVAQQLVVSLLNEEPLASRLMCLQANYRQRRDSFDALLQTHFSDIANWQTPRGGLFFWLQLKPAYDLDLKALLPDALHEGVAFMPGTEFCPADATDSLQMLKGSMRLNFSHAQQDEAQVGLAKLSRLIRRHLE